MILAFDTFYFGATAKTCCVQFLNWSDKTPFKTFEESINDVEEYKSGEFYKRELPCILSLLKQIDLKDCEAIVIDGFVNLDDDGKYGLGAYLYDELEGKIPVIGVAKNDFRNIKKTRVEVFRGKSKKPLYVTSKGIDLMKASDLIENMQGNYRIPSLLKLVDSLGRN